MYYYTKQHIWVKIYKYDKNIVYLGFTAYKELKIIDIKNISFNLKKNLKEKKSVVFTLQGYQYIHIMTIYINSYFTFYNLLVLKYTELINANPIKRLWILKLRVKNHIDVFFLLNAREYKSYISML
jgi:glycine cleavage system H lipoate-binding protein